MNNLILNFDLDLTDEYIVRNYFSKDIFIDKLFTFEEDFIEVYLMNINDKLERISDELYGTTKYWDLLLMLNSRDPLFQMFYDYDLIVNAAEKYSSKIADIVGERLEVFKNNKIKELETLNETYQKIFVISKNRINDVILILKQNGVL